jgi:large subunit ribosomal protein L4
MELSVKNQGGETVDTIVLDDAVFSIPMNMAVVHQALVIYQANKRQGTRNTKTRGDVSGGGRKPWIQKHTGRARQGSIRSPQWRHGGVVFGPHPRDFRKDLPRRMRRLALKCVLSEKARLGRLVCLESMDTLDGKTQSMVALLDKLGISGSALVVTREPESEVIRAAYNLKNIWTLPVNLLNAHELLRRDTVIMSVAAARWAEHMWAVEPHGRRGLNLGLAPTSKIAVASSVEEILTSEVPPEKETRALPVSKAPESKSKPQRKRRVSQKTDSE